MAVVYGPEQHHRRSVRLRGYDYTQACAYFLTICSRDRACIFYTVGDGAIHLTPVGEVIAYCWEAIPDHFSRAEMDAFVIMPNHVHGIVILHEHAGSEQGTACLACAEAHIPQPSRPVELRPRL
jgi:putative transposase